MRISMNGIRTRVFLALLPCVACVQLNPQRDFERARALVTESTGIAEVFDPYSPAVPDAQIAAMIEDGLSLDESLQITLLNNREIQAEFQSVGIAHTEWVQSQLLSNPSLEVLSRFPSGGGSSAVEVLLGFELLETFRISKRKAVATSELGVTVFRVAQRAVSRLSEARAAYYRAVTADKLHDIAEKHVELVTQSHEAVQELHAAGAADALDESLALSPVLAARLAVRAADAERANARRALARVLSLDTHASKLKLTDGLPFPMKQDLDIDTLIEQARESRLDLRAWASAVIAGKARQKLEKSRSWGALSFGPSVEKGRSETLIGTSISTEIPIFDRNHAQISRAGFETAKLEKLYQSAQVAVGHDVRAGVRRLRTALHNIETYKLVVLPQAEEALRLAQTSFSEGQSTILSLLEVQQRILSVKRDYVRLRLEAATASSELERAIGRPISSP